MRKSPPSIIVLCLLFWELVAVTTVPGQVTVHADSFYSPALRRTMKYMAILPEHSDVSKRYPVLFLLHGVFGAYTDWTSRTRVADYCASYSLIVIMPDAGDSWYVNASTDPEARFEDYLTQDLRGYILAKYPVDSARCAIAGLSMGGYGAVKTALRYPGRYFFAGSLSGLMSIVDSSLWKLEKVKNPALVLTLSTAFGGASQEFLDDQNTLRLARRATGPGAPYIYLSAGIQDGFRSLLPANRALAESLRVNAIPYEYHEIPGAHSWIFWNREIQPLLRRLMDLAPRVQ